MLLAFLKDQAKQFLRLSARLLGWRLLNKSETDDLLSPYLVASTPADQIPLPTIYDTVDPARQVFGAKDALTQPTRVWHLPTSASQTHLLAGGLLMHKHAVLCTDYWTHHTTWECLKIRGRKVVYVDTVVAPFGHQPDMLTFGGYYDYIYLIFAKLCRIEKTWPGGFAEVAVSYPLFYTAYETELLTLLGFTPDRIFDSREYDVRAKTYLLGNGGDWFYPNVADLITVRERLLPLVAVGQTQKGSSRLYISRAGRRRVTNEDALMNLLHQFDFTYIEDKPRPIGEQLSLYRGASFIIGPHGASFSNIAWCEPRTYLHELCSVNYAPDFFLYLATLRQMTYSASLHGVARRQRIVRSLVENITVSLPRIDRFLQTKLSEGTLSA